MLRPQWRAVDGTGERRGFREGRKGIWKNIKSQKTGGTS